MIKVIRVSSKLFWWAFKDLLVLKIPGVRYHDYEFAFLVHPRDERDAARRFGFAKFLPKFIVSLWTKHFWPVRLSKITGVKNLETGQETPGVIIACPMVAHQMLSDRTLAQKRIRQSVKLAEKYGAKVIGLGALTASLTAGGLDIEKETKAGLVTGRAMTPLIVSRYVLDGLKLAKHNIKTTRIGIVGAAGGIGSLTTQILAEKGARNLLLLDIERKHDRLHDLSKDLKKRHPEIKLEITDDLTKLKLLHIFVTATNTPEALVTSENVGPGTIIIDDAQPTDLAEDVYARSDVVVAGGGIIKAPGVSGHLHLNFSDREENFSCFAEVVALAAHGRFDDFSLGYPTLEQVEEIDRLSADLGITRGTFQNHTRVYSEEEIKNISKQA